jgi:7-carboxy-7-deazaguanine synthase
LRCSYCDTEYAFTESSRHDLEDLLEEVLLIGTPLVEITGGEPLLQPAVHELERRLLDAGRTVLIETSGACDISKCDERSVVIMDFKTPSSGEHERLDVENIARLRPHHEVKFVIGNRQDYDWATDMIKQHRLVDRVKYILMSPVFQQPEGLHIAGHPGLEARELADWILEDRLPVRMQLQLHKFIWDPRARGV